MNRTEHSMPGEPSPVSEEELLELVKIFENFTEASSTFAQSYRTLEERISELNAQLDHQTRLLNRTEGFLTSVLDHAPVGILVLDIDGLISLFNAEAEKLTGLRARDVVGKSYGDVFDCMVTNPDSTLFTLTNGSERDTREKSFTIQGGGGIPVRFSTCWVLDEGGERSGVMEVFEDLRKMKELQERMERNANLAALGEMAAQVAHELRNPLAGVQGFAQFLLEDLPEDHSARQNAEKIVAGVKDINDLANRLLEFTRPLSVNFGETDLLQLLQGEVELIRAEVAENKSTVDIELKLPEESVPVICDANLMKQVMLNLLKNALQAIGAEGGIVVVELHWGLLRNRVRITVTDNGRGIEEEHIDKIFNPFFTTRSRGTGLGLSMVKKIVDAHDGDIQVTCGTSDGSRFSVELPITRDV